MRWCINFVLAVSIIANTHQAWSEEAPANEASPSTPGHPEVTNDSEAPNDTTLPPPPVSAEQRPEPNDEDGMNESGLVAPKESDTEESEKTAKAAKGRDKKLMHEILATFDLTRFDGRMMRYMDQRLYSWSYGGRLSYRLTHKRHSHNLRLSAAVGDLVPGSKELTSTYPPQYQFYLAYSYQYRAVDFQLGKIPASVLCGATLSLDGNVINDEEIFFTGIKSLGINARLQSPINDRHSLYLEVDIPVVSLVSRNPWSVYDSEIIHANKDDDYLPLIFGGDVASFNRYFGVYGTLGYKVMIVSFFGLSASYSLTYHRFFDHDTTAFLVQELRLGTAFTW